MSDQPPTLRSVRPQPQPEQSYPEHSSLIAAIVLLAFAVALTAADQLAAFDVNRSAYAALTGLWVVAGCAWIVTSAERRVRRTIEALMADRGQQIESLREEVADLAAAVDTLIRHAQQARHGRVYAAAAGQADTVDLRTMPAVDPEALAAAQRIRLRILKGGDGNPGR